MKVRMWLDYQKLHILTTHFETLMMKEYETISGFNGRLCDITNEAFVLGKKYSN